MAILSLILQEEDTYSKLPEVINLDKENKENNEMPEDPVEEPTGEEKIQDKAKDAVEEKQEEKVDEPVKDSEPVEKKSTEKPAESPVETKKAIEDEQKKKPVKAVPKEEPEKKQKDKKEGTKKQAVQKDGDFRYIVRISNTDIGGEKRLIFGLTSIKGIGHHMAVLIANELDVDQNKKVGDLSDKEIEDIQNTVDSVIEIAPAWMLNHRKFYETGKDVHLIGPEIDLRLRDEVNIMKKIRSYSGIRHERGLPVRGQRTRANNRKGLALGVSKRRDPGKK